MANFFYIDANGQKQGDVTDQQLKELAAQGVITPTTPLETDTGHKGTAGQIPGLFAAAPSPFAQPAQVTEPPSTNLFCTNCGKHISEQAVACMSCGASPFGHRKFCCHCGVALNPEQVVCVKCGAAINTAAMPRTAGNTTGASGKSSWAKSRIAAGLLAILLGWVGAHKYYMGSWGWGLVFTAVLILTGGILGLALWLTGLFEGIQYLTMTDETFAENYPPETEAPFRW